MKNRIIGFLSICACAGIAQGGVLSVDVKPYDFNSIVAKGTAANAGTVSLTINGGEPIKKNVSAGAYEIAATGLTAGNVYSYVVSLGADSKTGEIVLGNGTGKLFGADATGGSDATSNGSWSTTAPYAEPMVVGSAYSLQGSSNLFNVASTPVGKIVYIDSNMTFIDGADELDDGLSALGAFTLAQDDELNPEAYRWAGLTGRATKWVTLTGVTAEPGAYVSRMEFDFNGATKLVRYSIKASGAPSFTVLKNGSTEWFPVNSSADSVTSVAFEGTGTLAKFEGSSVDAAVAKVNGTSYSTIASALASDKTGKTVTLLTNTKPVANSALENGTWTIEGAYAFEPSAATGYDFTYEGNTFKVMAYLTKVPVTGSANFGCDFTNGVLNVAVSGAEIQAGTSVSLEVTVKDSTGTTVGTTTYAGITGDTNKEFSIPGSLTVKGDYTYEVVVKKDGETLGTATGSFTVGNETNWFSADRTNWANNGNWTKNGEATTVTGDKLALGGSQYDFTPVAPTVSNAIVRVDTVIEIDGAVDNEDLPTETDVQGMIAVAETSSADSTPVWKAYLDSAWVALTGGETSVGTYTVRAEFDYTRNPKAVRYSVAKGAEPFVVLKNGTTEWLANGKSDAQTLERTSAVGVGNIVSLVGNNIDAFVAEVDGVKYESLQAALAAAGIGGTVKLLWNCSWTPSTTGMWTISPDGKTLIVYTAGGYDVDYENGVLQASNVKVAQVGETEYYLLKKAFAAEGETVTMLTNVVQGVDVAVPTSKTLDLAGWFVSGSDLVVAAGQIVTFTNSTEVAGGFAMGVTGDGAYAIKGGKWVGNGGVLGAGFKFVELAEPVTVDGVTYHYAAIATTAGVAKVYPVADGKDTVGEAVVEDVFIADNIPGSSDMKPEEIAAALNASRAEGNGLPLIQSYVLGLKPNEPKAKPVVNSAQVADTDKVRLSLGNVTVNTAAGVKVRYSLSTATDPSFAGATTTEAQESPTFDAALDSSKVKYFKINILFGN